MSSEADAPLPSWSSLYAAPRAKPYASLGCDFCAAELPAVDVALPCGCGALRVAQLKSSEGLGAVVWHAGVALARLIAGLDPARVSAPRVVELGCGTGVSGLAAAAAHPGADVTLTDDASLRALALGNAAAASPAAAAALDAGRVRFAPYRWGAAPPPEAAGLAPPYDWVVAADCLYEPDALAPLVESIDALADAGTLVLLGYMRRHDERERVFFEALAARGFDTRLLPAAAWADPAAPAASREDVFVLLSAREAGAGVDVLWRRLAGGAGIDGSARGPAAQGDGQATAQ